MSNLANARTKFFTGGTYAAGDDLSLVAAWTEVADLTDIGDFGDEAEAITYEVIGDGRTRKLKGTRNAGTFDVTVARKAGDPGQDAMKVAELANSPVSLKVELEDGTQFLFAGLVMSAKRTLGGANDVIKITYAIEITTEVDEVAA